MPKIKHLLSVYVFRSCENRLVSKGLDAFTKRMDRQKTAGDTKEQIRERHHKHIENLKKNTHLNLDGIEEAEFDKLKKESPRKHIEGLKKIGNVYRFSRNSEVSVRIHEMQHYSHKIFLEIKKQYSAMLKEWVGIDHGAKNKPEGYLTKDEFDFLKKHNLLTDTDVDHEKDGLFYVKDHNYDFLAAACQKVCQGKVAYEIYGSKKEVPFVKAVNNLEDKEAWDNYEKDKKGWDQKNETYQSWEKEVKSLEVKQIKVPSAKELLSGEHYKKYEKLLKRVYEVSAETGSQIIVRHKVKSGETLGKIAKKHGVDWRTISVPSGDKNKIYPGDVLQIPLKSKKLSGEIPKEVKILFQGIDTERLKNDLSFARSLRQSSRIEFENKVRNVDDSILTKNQKAELIAAFKSMETALRTKGSQSLERLTVLNKISEKVTVVTSSGEILKGKNQVNELFKKEVGYIEGFERLYEQKNLTPEQKAENRKNKEAVLKDSDVFVFFIDQNPDGKLVGRVDQSEGSGWINAERTPEEMRDNKDYNPRYREIKDSLGILIRYLNLDKPRNIKYKNIIEGHFGKKLSGLNLGELSEIRGLFKVAEIEISNCENPAIVVKPLTDKITGWLKGPENPGEEPNPPKCEYPVVFTYKNVKKVKWYEVPFRLKDTLFTRKSLKNGRLDVPSFYLTKSGKIKKDKPNELIDVSKRVKLPPRKITSKALEQVLKINRNERVKELDVQWRIKAKENLEKRKDQVVLIMEGLDKLDEELTNSNETAKQKLDRRREKIKEFIKDYSQEAYLLALLAKSVNKMMDYPDPQKPEEYKKAYEELISLVDREHEALTVVKYSKTKEGKKLIANQNSTVNDLLSTETKYRDDLVGVLEKYGVITKNGDKYEVADKYENMSVRVALEDVSYKQIKYKRESLFIVNNMFLLPSVQGSFSIRKPSTNFLMSQNANSGLGIVFRLAGYAAGLDLIKGINDGYFTMKFGSIAKLPEKFDKTGQLADIVRTQEEYDDLKLFLETGTINKGCLMVLMRLNDLEVGVPGINSICKIFATKGKYHIVNNPGTPDF